jgi:hypothetical protein
MVRRGSTVRIPKTLCTKALQRQALYVGGNVAEIGYRLREGWTTEPA